MSFFSGAEIDSFATDMSKELNREALPKLRAALEMRDDKFGYIFDVPLSVYKRAIRSDAEARAYDGFIFRTCQAARKVKGVHLTIFESEEHELMRTDPIEYKMGRMLYERMRGFHLPKTATEKREYIKFFENKKYFSLGADLKETQRAAADLRDDWEQLPSEKRLEWGKRIKWEPGSYILWYQLHL